MGVRDLLTSRHHMAVGEVVVSTVAFQVLSRTEKGALLADALDDELDALRQAVRVYLLNFIEEDERGHLAQD